MVEHITVGCKWIKVYSSKYNFFLLFCTLFELPYWLTINYDISYPHLLHFLNSFSILGLMYGQYIPILLLVVATFTLIEAAGAADEYPALKGTNKVMNRVIE